MYSFSLILLSNGEFSPEQAEIINQIIRTKSIAKGQILLRKGELSTKSYFVKKGCLRCYSIDEKGKEHIFMFAPEGWIASDIVTQPRNVPSGLLLTHSKTAKWKYLTSSRLSRRVWISTNFLVQALKNSSTELRYSKNALSC